MLCPVLLMLLVFAASALTGSVDPINDDDTFHLHSTWSLAHGYLPYQDFFEHHPPGIWLALAGWAWIVPSPSWFVVSGRLLVAVLLAACAWLLNAIVRARGWQTALMSVLLLGVMVRVEWFRFRVEYVVSFLVVLHVWLLTKTAELRRPVLLAGLAAIPLGLACTISARAAMFLPIEPMLLIFLFRRQYSRLAATLAAWGLGGLGGAAPTIVYLSVHGLWQECWRWSVVFATTIDVVRFQWNWDPHAAKLGLIGLAALSLLPLARQVPVVNRYLLGAAWALAFLFWLANPLPQGYTRVHGFMFTTALAALAPFVVLDRLRVPAWLVSRVVSPILVLLAAVWFVTGWEVVSWQRCLAMRHAHRAQLTLLDWLRDVAGEEAVVLVDPYHSLLTPDATYLRSSWQYTQWLRNPMVRPRLDGLAKRLLGNPPPVIAADPSPTGRPGDDLLVRLQRQAVISPAEAGQLRQMIQTRFVLVHFPELAPQEGLPYGNSFWVRNDRIGVRPIPLPHTRSQM
jgi:hypothetical protein